MGGLSVQAKEARRDYKRRYRLRNREKINDQQRAWRKKNPDRVREYQAQYWNRRAGKERNIRASWEDYGITPERLAELTGIARSERYASRVLSAALAADEKAAGHIILSVTENLSYERVEFHERLGRCPLGRTDFYGVRRLFFHHLDCAMRNGEAAAQEERHG